MPRKAVLTVTPLRLVLLAALLFRAASVTAGASPSDLPGQPVNALSRPGQPVASDFTPYRARYTSDWRYGLALTGEATRELRRGANGTWIHSLEASVGALVRHYEESQLAIEGPTIKPLEYRYQRKILNRERQAHLHFDWADQQVTNQVDGDAAWKMLLPKGTQDHLSYQLQLRYDLLLDKEDLHYQIADGGHLKSYGFEVIGEEKLATPVGTYTTVRVRRARDKDSSRETQIWFAKELDYVIVKFYQRESDGKSYELIIDQYEALR